MEIPIVDGPAGKRARETLKSQKSLFISSDRKKSFFLTD
jgi:hypothetical protein